MNRHFLQSALLLAALICAASLLTRTARAQSADSSQAAAPSAATLSQSPQTTPSASASTITQSSPAPALGASNDRRSFLADERSEIAASAPSAGSLLLRTLGALLLIIGLVVASAWALKRVGGARFGSPREDAPELAVIATVALGDRRSIAAVRFGERTLLLGSTSQGITLLATEEGTPRSFQPPVRSVADLLQASEEQTVAALGETGAFHHELSSAEQRFARVREAERQDGGEA
jgi:flagellar protein FliO/FliZ